MNATANRTFQVALSYDKLIRAAASIQSKTNRKLAFHIIEQGRVNANQTVDVERAASDEQWDEIFRGSIGTLLASGEYDRHVCGFFTKNGLSF